MFGRSYAENNFKQERRFLMVTVFCFTVAYFLLAIQSCIGSLFLYKGGEMVEEILCEQGIKSLVYNITNVLIVDQIPFAAIFSLHWINFRKETHKQAMVEASSSQEQSTCSGENNFKSINRDNLRYTTSAMLQPILTTETAYDDTKSKHTRI